MKEKRKKKQRTTTKKNKQKTKKNYRGDRSYSERLNDFVVH